MPYCGVNLRYNLFGTFDEIYADIYGDEIESYDYDIFDKYEMEGCAFERFQPGLKLGADVEFKNITVGVSYVTDFAELFDIGLMINGTLSTTSFSIGFKF